VTQTRQYAGGEGSGTYQDTTMTYDGYGRLKTKHVPEQNTGTARTWSYNADDTINTITDARGAITTFGYAGTNRKFVTSITHTFAGQPNETASFSYDAAGNRTAMTDGLGTSSYEYDELSRLVVETRGFTGVGNYPISYQYNFANDLKSITDPLNSTINYTRDTASRLTTIARNGQTFASGIEYRASGAIKYMLYGDNSAMNVTFTSRMQPAAFTIPGKISKTYTYNNDGTLRFSSDLIDHRFDRFYGFDHVGRLKSALSGAEARGEGTTTNRPYNQTHGYDGFGHLNYRNAKTWWTGDSTMSVTFVNNRQQGWAYDADGRVVDGNEYHTYDAAGRNNYLSTYGYGTATTTFDGDGRQIKTVETSYDEEWNEISETKYYIRSTVLGGQVLAEINQTSSEMRRYVYAGPTVLAWIYSYPGFESVSWEQRDPSGASVRGIGQQELDPLGADAGTYATSVSPTEGPLMSYGSSYSPANPGVTYTVDGMRVSADDFMRRLDVEMHYPMGWVDASARASARPIGKRNTGVSWGRPFEVIYDANGKVVSQTWGEYDPQLINVNFGTESLLYSNQGIADLAAFLQNTELNKKYLEPPKLKGNPKPNEIDAFNQSYKLFTERLQSRPGCAEFFGSAETALKKLHSLSISFIDLGGPVPVGPNRFVLTAAQVDNKSIRINNQGPFMGNHSDLEYFGVSVPLAGAIILAHEVAHPLGKIPTDGDYGKGVVTSEDNTWKVIQACFLDENGAVG
jgi:YD repeat-containing protein